MCWLSVRPLNDKREIIAFVKPRSSVFCVIRKSSNQWTNVSQWIVLASSFCNFPVESLLYKVHCTIGCFIFSPFLKLKKLGSVYDGILDTDFKSVIIIALWRHLDVAPRVRNFRGAWNGEFPVTHKRVVLGSQYWCQNAQKGRSSIPSQETPTSYLHCNSNKLQKTKIDA